VHSHRTVEVALRGVAGDGHGQPLHDCRRVGAEHVNAQHARAQAVEDQFHLGARRDGSFAFVIFGQEIRQRTE
jgi:hypothetical protein